MLCEHPVHASMLIFISWSIIVLFIWTFEQRKPFSDMSYIGSLRKWWKNLFGTYISRVAVSPKKSVISAESHCKRSLANKNASRRVLSYLSFASVTARKLITNHKCVRAFIRNHHFNIRKTVIYMRTRTSHKMYFCSRIIASVICILEYLSSD